MYDFTPTYYKIIINATGLGGVAPADGFIDPTPAQNYPTLCSTIDLAFTKKRANLRWLKLTQTLSEVATPTKVYDFVATGADQDTPATSLEFKISFDRPACLVTADELTPGAELTGMDALKRMVARALIEDVVTKSYVVGPQVTLSTHIDQSGIKEITAGALAATIASTNSKITVTQLT